MYDNGYGDGHRYEYEPQQYAYPPQAQPPPYRQGRGAGPAFVLLAIIGLIIFFVIRGVSLPDAPDAEKPPQEIAVEAVVPDGMRPCATAWNPGSNEACKKAKNYAAKKVTDKTQLGCLDELWHNEANWDAWADNKGSSAFGIPQGLTGAPPAFPNGHGNIYGPGEWQKQVDWGLGYVRIQYQTPCNALAFWKRQNPHWY